MNAFRAAACTVLCAVCAGFAAAPAMSLNVTEGKALVWNREVGGWTSVKDSAAIVHGDSIFVDRNEAAVLKLGDESDVMLKGVCRVVVNGAERDVSVALVEGQLFLLRRKPYEFNVFSLTARDCRFTPIGTAAAVKFTRMGEPSVAMLSGKMRVEGPGGVAELAEAGQSVTFDRGNQLQKAPLSAQAIEALELWSGLRYDGPPPASPAAESVDESAPAVALAQQDAGDASDAQQAVAVADDAPQTAPQAAATPARRSRAQAQPKSGAGDDTPVTPADDASEGQDDAPDTDSDNGRAEKRSESRQPDKAQFVGGVSVTTVDDEQWTMLHFGVDVPIGKFGVFLDLEVWLNAQGSFSNKGWEFTKDTWARDLFRKIRYVRFGHAGDPFFVKFGGLSSVSMGYGFLVDRFTNMLHYPDEKLLGLQMELNDIGPIGVTFQGLIADFYDFGNQGGVIASRLGFRFLKSSDIPLLNRLLLAGTYAVDINQFAPAKNWRYLGNISDKDGGGLTDWDYAFSQAQTTLDSNAIWHLIDNVPGIIDDTSMVYETPDTVYRDSTERFSALGFDIGLPIISNKALRLDLYGQAATRMDDVSGWGFGAPGLLFTFVPARRWAWFGIEYRHIRGEFEPGYFNTYYLDERLERYPTVEVKSRTLPDVSLNGVFGRLGVNIGDVLIVSGDYQYLGTSKSTDHDQRYEARAEIGRLLVDRIPKFTLAEIYIHKRRVGEKIVFDGHDAAGDPVFVRDAFFEKTPYLYWGYRLGFEITKGSALVWNTRHGWRYNSNYKLKSNNTISISTVFTF